MPILKDGDLTVWDSLAIIEYAAEKFPEAGIWPKDARARALARSISAEMHSGFVPLRNLCNMNTRKHYPGFALTPEVEADVARIDQIWIRHARGPWQERAVPVRRLDRRGRDVCPGRDPLQDL